MFVDTKLFNALSLLILVLSLRLILSLTTKRLIKSPEHTHNKSLLGDCYYTNMMILIAEEPLTFKSILKVCTNIFFTQVLNIRSS